MRVRVVNGQPKPGHEFAYWLAMKHRAKLAGLMTSEPLWSRIFRPGRQMRLTRLWIAAFRRGINSGRDWYYEI